MKQLTWFIDNAKKLSLAENMCHVTGWTSAENPDVLNRALDQAEIHATIRYARAPAFSTPPVSMQLPFWARPFRLFLDMQGTPDSMEVDPSSLLPIIIPLLFGYMFPDIGHGLLLILFSILLYRKWPQGRFLIPCGISAVLFGAVFGELFGMEGFVDPIWVHPMDNPLVILAAPLVFGVALLLLGLIFNGIEAYWRGEIRIWLLRDAAVLMLFSTSLVGIFYVQSFWLAVAALIWFLLGQLFIDSTDRFFRLINDLGLLLRVVFELFLSTFSFLRVGAFALAHAGLSSAIMQLAAGINDTSLYILFLILGHAFIIITEGLVVFIQTSRLVLFEFFTRFLKANGRLLRPLHN